MTTVISSQRYIDNDILNAKIAQIEAEKPEAVTLNVYAYNDEFAVLPDGHHTYEAAMQCDVPVIFEIVNHPEGLTGDNLLEQSWIDSDWYDVKTGRLAF